MSIAKIFISMSKRLPLETKNTLQIRKWECRFYWLFLSSNEVCNIVYAWAELHFQIYPNDNLDTSCKK